jgi:hypothetical protein
MEEVATKVIKANKTTELFQTMAIDNLNMRNLTMEVNTLRKQIGYKGEGKGSVIGGIG